MFSRVTSDTVSPSSPAVGGPTSFSASTGIDKESEVGLGPSAFQGTARPYLARLLDMGSQDILTFGLRDSLRTVDSYVLGLVKERNWVDTKESYERVLSELKLNLGIDPSLQPMIALERLEKGVRLLTLQAMHRRRDREIQNAIVRLNTKP